MRHCAAAMVAIASALSGCATVVDGSKQEMSLSSSPQQGADCTLHSTEGTWTLTTPGSVKVHKTKNDLMIDCTKDGFKPGHMVAIAHFGGATFGNIVLGGGVGAIVDAASGANYYYDSPLVVPLGEPLSPPAPEKPAAEPAAAGTTGGTGAPAAKPAD
jgi:hypothetical protein